VSPILVAVLLAVPAICTLVAWLSWLRFARYVFDRSRVEGLEALPPIATAFLAHTWGLLRARSARQPEEAGSPKSPPQPDHGKPEPESR
jgi:hypothetical protein